MDLSRNIFNSKLKVRKSWIAQKNLKAEKELAKKLPFETTTLLFKLLRQFFL